MVCLKAYLIDASFFHLHYTSRIVSNYKQLFTVFWFRNQRNKRVSKWPWRIFMGGHHQYFVKCGLETSCAQKHQYSKSRQRLASTMLFSLALLLILYLHNNKQCIIVAPWFNLLICKMAMKHLFLCTNGNSLAPCCSGQWKQETVEIYTIIFSMWKLTSKKHISDI